MDRRIFVEESVGSYMSLKTFMTVQGLIRVEIFHDKIRILCWLKSLTIRILNLDDRPMSAIFSTIVRKLKRMVKHNRSMLARFD